MRLACLVAMALAFQQSELNQRVAQLDIDTATMDQVVRLFGEPQAYFWGNQTFAKETLPNIYLARYPGPVQFLIRNGAVIEMRFETPDYTHLGSIRVGSPLAEVLRVLGQPRETVTGQANDFRDTILFQNINGQPGIGYYSVSAKRVRLFFRDDKVAALYIARREQFRPYEPSGVLAPYADVRSLPNARVLKDVSKLDLSQAGDVIPTLTFNQKTLWPPKMPAGVQPDEILKLGMNPGLGVRELHRQGITGKGVNVAIIDQPLLPDHPEYAGKILYHDVGCESQTSMHGPAVASLLVGKNTGVAPDAKVYFAAAPSWLQDSAYYAKALDWILEENAKLPARNKIRVVSVSAAPSGESSPMVKNREMWDQAVARAEQAGLLVLDCTRHRGIIGSCWYDLKDREDPAKCRPGFPGVRQGASPRLVLAPTSPRTTAEQYQKDEFGYQFTGRGGLSWAIPYAAGVLALGWQQRPELTSQQMTDLLFRSAHAPDGNARIIHPKEFLRLVREFAH